MMQIWVDADACPVPIRDIIARAAHKLHVPTVFVANSLIGIPESPYLSFVQVSHGPDIADAYVAEQASKGDLVVTQDIPLAALVVAKGAIAITPRGQLYTEQNINEALAGRDLMTSLRDTGTITGGPRPFDEKVKRQFANHFDAALRRLL
jgi:uncharacterized protein YaiI (UPF0178 family)